MHEIDAKGYEVFNILCCECERLLFRVRGVRIAIGTEEDALSGITSPIYQDAYAIDRKCLKSTCGRVSTVYVTQRPGYPLAKHGHHGPWRCTCNGFLGNVIAGRGRVTVHCRSCDCDRGITIATSMAPDVMAAAIRAYKDAHPEPSDDIDDMPF